MMRGRVLVNRLAQGLFTAWLLLLASFQASAEDGYDLWLRYRPLAAGEAGKIEPYLGRGVQLLADPSPTVNAALAELSRAKGGMGIAGKSPHPQLVLARSEQLADAGFGEDFRLTDAAPGAFSIRRVRRDRIMIAANDDIGLLYGTFAFLRHIHATGSVSGVERFSAPTMPLRMLNHWDNPDGHVERGYAGRSIFDWWHLPEKLDPKMIDYARANASIGINGVVVNNVNARAFMLEPRYIAKLKRLADAWRPYGVRVYLSVRFSAPRDIGGLDTADPLDLAVRTWWKAKADEIYAEIPDFGGFLVKANSEGQPGPQDYGRDHADGANMLAEAIGDRGTVIWRAFVYSEADETDRAKQAYAEFVPLDGKFADNVIVQVKNGPIDFQPREPFHPIFGAMPTTRLMIETQITREYLGQASGMVYLAPMWTEILRADTGRGGTVAEIVRRVGMAGVANTGSAQNWTGTHFDQANWYAFGRLAWDPMLSSEEIAIEWTALTFTREPQRRDTIVQMMLGSRETVVKYMTPLGLAHLMDTGHHYGPAPWVCDLSRPEWNPCYYHRADAEGIGFDRTATGSNALAQYSPEIASQWSNPAAMDERFLLWFHRVPWDYRMQSGLTLWEELVARYDEGEREAAARQHIWDVLAPHIDVERHRQVAADLAIQSKEARWWRDASLSYWRTVNGLDFPPGTREPAETLKSYQSRRFPEAPGQ